MFSCVRALANLSVALAQIVADTEGNAARRGSRKITI